MKMKTLRLIISKAFVVLGFSMINSHGLLFAGDERAQQEQCIINLKELLSESKVIVICDVVVIDGIIKYRLSQILRGLSTTDTGYVIPVTGGAVEENAQYGDRAILFFLEDASHADIEDGIRHKHTLYIYDGYIPALEMDISAFMRTAQGVGGGLTP